MKIILLGNGPSLKQIIDYGFDKFMTFCNNNDIKVFCMNKILRYLKKHNIQNLPHYYVATDSFVNIQMYDEILEYSDKFEKLYVSVPAHYSVENDKLNIYKFNERQKISLNTDKNQEYYDHLISQIKETSTINVIKHNSTGLECFNIATKMKPDTIYLIGYDENYNLQNKTHINTNDIENRNDNYFSDTYLKDNEYVSSAPSERLNCINSTIKECKIPVYNLNTESKVAGEKMTLETFFN